MSNIITVETIQVMQVGKYGVRVDEKTWYGVNEPLTPMHFVPQQSYKVSISTSKTGKKYIKEVISVSEAPAPVPVQPTEVAVVAKPAVQVDAERAKYYTQEPKKALDAKDIRIVRQGCFQAALHSPALTTWAVSVDEYLALVRKAAEAGIKFTLEA